MKQLIINADDFGLHELINEGIVEAYTAGCVTSTSIMAGGGAFEHAVNLIEKHSKLGVGVHLTLVGANPVARSDIHTLLTQDGAFLPNYSQFIKRYVSGQISNEHIEWEFLCQMQKVAGTGIKITHIDSHQHLHVLPGIQKIICRVAREFGVDRMRIPAEPVGFIGMGDYNINRFFARAALTGCSFLAQRVYAREGFVFPQHFFGMLEGGAMTQLSLSHILQELPNGISEIMVHPGKETATLGQLFPWSYHWGEELMALKDEKVLDCIKRNEIQMINYGDLEKRCE
ncbi:ChbG/HpnK family deacetylase [Anaerosinus massiliensis]|uniref:ChbG/HpnK family deacetylase n=1 Tax=Massilibacillus massiliensis TaxID=1806837 RepID=UPI000ACFC3D4|nr:ChbG/HpnK family deacetylase [Massilibacillus massiliensis]